jgi:putative ABC transport system permease protein
VGICIGVASVITVMATGEGLKNDVKSTVSQFGANLIIVLPGNLESVSGRGVKVNPAAFISGDIITDTDVAALRALPGVSRVIPMALVPLTVRRNSTPSNATVIGTFPDILEGVTGVRIARGRIIEDRDQGERVIVLGHQPSAQLFGDADPIGETVLVGKEAFTVIGVLSQTTAAGSLTGQDVETISFIPYDTATALTGKKQIHRLVVKASAGVDTKELAAAMKRDLARRHEEGDVSVLTSDDLLDLLDSVLGTITLAISAIAATSLLVGGIGIMNIMLVSVTERTREIGIRKAVGATHRAILTQFLIEAIVISLLGGLLGLGLAMVGVAAVAWKTALLPTITPVMIVLAVGVSVGVGIIFGLAPAISAAHKDPIEALRYE